MKKLPLATIIGIVSVFSTDFMTSNRANSKPLCIEALDHTKGRISLDKTEINGITLNRILMSGIMNPDSKIGCYAANASSYEDFGDIFEYVIKKYHRLDKIVADEAAVSHNYRIGLAAKGELSDQIKADFEEETKGRIISTRIRVARNLSNYNFPSSMTMEDRMRLEKEVKDFFNSDAFKSTGITGKYYSIHALTPQEREQLISEHILYKDLTRDRFMTPSGIANDWPVGRGIFISNDKKTIVWVNEEDHLRLISMEESGNIKAVLENLNKLVGALGQRFQFAKSKDKYGYLTSCPTNIGSGMRASVLIKLGDMKHGEDEMRSIAKDLGLDMRGLSGEHSEAKGGIFDISNSVRLGKSEVVILNQMIANTNKLATTLKG